MTGRCSRAKSASQQQADRVCSDIRRREMGAAVNLQMEPTHPTVGATMGWGARLI